jgi:hypothetical protein
VPIRLICVAILVMAAAGSAAAEARRVLVFPVGEGEPASRFTKVIARAAGLTGAEVTIGGASFDDTAALAGCADQEVDCMKAVAASLGADEVVVGTFQTGSVALRRYHQGQITTHTVAVTGTEDEMVAQLARDVAPIFVGSTPVPEKEPDPPKKPDPPPVIIKKPIEKPLPPPVVEKRGVSAAWWIVAGGGVALLAGGGYFLLQAGSTQDEVDAAPTNTVMDLDRLAALEDEGATQATIGSVLAISGGALLVVGGIAIVLQATGGTPAPERTGSITITPAILRGGAAVTLELSLP